MISSDWEGVHRHPEWLLDRIVATRLNPASAVLVTGFWRSGTTWLQQVLAGGLRAKSIFEPFFQDLSEYDAVLEEDFDLPYASPEYVSMFMPYGKTSLPKSSGMYHYLRNALRGTTPSSWVRGVRFRRRGIEGRLSRGRLRDALDRVKDAFRRRVVVKSVRAHLLLPAIHETFDPRIIHIRRDPRSVIASLHRKGWTDKWAGEISLVDQLLRPTDGRISFFEEWESEIRAYDQKSVTHRLAAYWSLCEKFVSSLPDHHRRAALSHEELYLKGSQLLEKKLRSLAFVDDPSEYFGAPSAMSEKREHTTEERLRRWKEMDVSKIEAVETTCQEFGMEDHLQREH